MNYYKIIEHSHYTRECIDAVHSEYNNVIVTIKSFLIILLRKLIDLNVTLLIIIKNAGKHR